MSNAVVCIGAAELRAMIREEAEAAVVAASRRAAAAVERLSANVAARMVKRRTELVLAAVASGALPATRTGKAWAIRAADLDTWAAAGCPEVPAAPAVVAP
jgi:hypothetical protein